MGFVQPLELGAELAGREVVRAAAVREQLVVHEHGHDAELVRLEAAPHGVFGRAGPRQRHELLGPGGRGTRSGSRKRRIRVERRSRIRDVRIPEQELVDAGRVRSIDLRPYVALSVVNAERKVLEPGHDARAGAADAEPEVGQRPPHDRIGLVLRVCDTVLLGAPVGGVEHRRDVVHLGGDGGDVLGDLLRPGGGDAEHGCAEERAV